jgi:hypothetical protein
MSLYSLIIENKNILELLYTLAISLICAVIVIKTDKFFRLSLYQGIRYFRNAFFFFGIGFIARYIFGIFSDFNYSGYIPVTKVIFEYFLIMGGFFLLYSLVWRKFEAQNEEYPISSLFNVKMGVFHVMALIIALLDNIWQTYYFMFTSQIAIFFSASIIAFINFKKNKRMYKFSKFYFLAMLLSLAAWTLNLLAPLYFNWNLKILIYIGIINIIFFLLFLYGVIKVTKIK